jgi:hypothetical protein
MMAEWLNMIMGSAVVALNLIPFALKQTKYIFLTSLVSLLLLLLLVYFRG